MHAHKIMLAIGIAATSLVVGTNTLTSALAVESAPPGLESMTCLMPKLCTDDVVLKGTTTHLTYVCPETKTVHVTETVWVTVSAVDEASTSGHGYDDKTTTIQMTGTSTILITKTVKSHLPSSLAANASSAMVSSSAVHTSAVLTSSLSSSVSTLLISGPKYTDTSVPQTQTKPAPTVYDTPESKAAIVTTSALTSATASISSNHTVPTQVTSTPHWLNSTTTSVLPKSIEFDTTFDLVGTGISTHMTLLPSSDAISTSTDGISFSSAVNSTVTEAPTAPSYATFSSNVYSILPVFDTSSYDSISDYETLPIESTSAPVSSSAPIPVETSMDIFFSPPGYHHPSHSDMPDLSKSYDAPGLSTDGTFYSSTTDLEHFPTITRDLPNQATNLNSAYHAAPVRRSIHNANYTSENATSVLYGSGSGTGTAVSQITSTVTLHMHNSTSALTQESTSAAENTTTAEPHTGHATSSKSRSATGTAAYPGASTEPVGNKNGVGKVEHGFAIMMTGALVAALLG